MSIMLIGSRWHGTISSQKYRPDIDGLRAVAVMLVIFYHAGFAPVSGGFIGVDVFFVISGYLISSIIIRELDDGTFTFVDFYSRRIKRICPALFAVLFLSCLFAFFVLIPKDLRNFGRSVASTVFFYSNWNFYTQVGYFDGPAIEKPLLHTWSLAIEEQFYLVWPVTVYGLYRAFGRKTLTQIIVALLFVSLVASQYQLDSDQSQVFYLLPFRAWELLLGALIAAALDFAISNRLANLLGILGVAAIGYAALAYDTKTPFPGFNALLPCLGTAISIFSGSQQAGFANKILGAAPVRFVGKISYSLYLIHWPLFSYAHLFVDRSLVLEERLAIIVLSMVMAAFSYWYVEMPARRAKVPFPVLLRAVVPAVGILALWGIIYHSSDGLPGRMPARVKELYSAKEHSRDPGCWNDPGTRNDPVPAFDIRPCAIGAFAPGMQYDFVIWGDSHSGHLTGAFSGQADSLGRAGLVIEASACRPFVNEIRTSKACLEHNALVARWIKTQRRLKAVFLAWHWNPSVWRGELDLPENWNTANGENSGVRDESSGHVGLGDTLKLLRSLDLNFAIVEDVPQFPMNISDCVARRRLLGRSYERCLTFTRRDVQETSERASSIVREISRRYSVPIIETVHAFCDKDACQTESDGMLLYADSHHLTNAGARYLGSRINIPWRATQAPPIDGAAQKVIANER